MDILDIIKKRCSIRKYQDKPIPKKIIDKIIEAGIWGPSVPSFLRIQPWKFIVIKNKNKINMLSKILLNKSRSSKTGVNILLKSASNIVRNADIVFAIYNSGDFKKTKNKFRVVFSSFSEVLEKAQLCAIAAAIQNMILTAESFKIGTCWLDMPLFCKNQINKLLKTNEELIAFLTLGYPAEKGKRALRKPYSEAVKYLT